MANVVFVQLTGCLSLLLTVAVTGLPNPDKEHAATMARFAKACMLKMDSLTRQLEVTLGPDTGDLSLRIGIHSGPVTAGILRGERSRFQLFGDTMNTGESGVIGLLVFVFESFQTFS